MNESNRKRIIKEAIACIAQNSNAGLDEIAEAAGVGRATLYRYFKSRADLLTELKLSAGKQLQDAVGPVFDSSAGARDKLVRCATLMVPLGASLNVSSYFGKPFKEKDEDPRVAANFEHHLAQVRQLCLALKAEGAILKQPPVVWLVKVLTSLVFAAWEAVESGDIAPKQAPWLVLETFLGGYGTPDTINWFNELKDAKI
ncbi:MAG: TetR/AcrR family transcriptional regulator [Desulfobacter sp.]|nr:MAG: TetR/AcrR family transcriptional regulator [Desulfobacter sp.]